MFIHSLISSWMPLVYFNLTPRYLNFSKFSVYKFLLLYFDFELHFSGEMWSCISSFRNLLLNSGTKAAVLLNGRSSIVNSGTQAAVLLGINRYGSFPLLSAPHSLFSIWTNLKRSEKIPGALAWKWEEWIWLTAPSGVHRNLHQGLNISCIGVFDQIRDLEIPITFHLHSKKIHFEQIEV